MTKRVEFNDDPKFANEVGLTKAEIAILPNLLALARMHIGAQLANGANDQDGRAIELLAAINSISAKLKTDG